MRATRVRPFRSDRTIRHMSTWLFQARSGSPFAWTVDEVNYWLADGTGWWAWRSGDWLYSAAGGAAIGWFSEGWFYEHGSGAALYFSGS